jgi:hypothetical protein
MAVMVVVGVMEVVVAMAVVAAMGLKALRVPLVIHTVCSLSAL